MRTPAFPATSPPRPPRAATRLGLLVLLAAAGAGCSMEGEDPPPTSLELSVTPTGEEISRQGALTITARVTPVPDEPLTFAWHTAARYGRLRDDAPFGEVIEVTSSGRSSVLYSAIQAGNPGGTDVINVYVRDANGAELAEGVAEISVAPPPVQMAPAVQVEYTTEGDIPGRLNIHILTAWPFEVVPGFDRYVFTVEAEAGEGWDVGDVGSTSVESLNGSLVDQEELVAAHGADYFELGEDQWALLSGGRVFGNFNPNDPSHVEQLEEMRQSYANLTQAVYSVRPLAP